MKKYQRDYQSWDDYGNEESEAGPISSFSSPDPDDASWNPGNLDPDLYADSETDEGPHWDEPEQTDTDDEE